MTENESTNCDICNLSFRDKYTLKRHLDRDSHKESQLKFDEMAEMKKVRVDKRGGMMNRLEEYQRDRDFTDGQIARVLEKEELLKKVNVKNTIIDCEAELDEHKAYLRVKKLIIDNLYTGCFAYL